MKVYGLQHDIAFENAKETIARVRGLLETAWIEPGSLLVLPEMFGTGFSMDVPRVVEEEAGEGHRFIAELAGKYRCCVVGGVVTPAADGRGRNCSIAVGPEGKLLARYQKMQPFTIGGETANYEAGNGVVLFDWGGFRVCPVICYDLRFPEVFRLGMRAGATMFVVIANWPVARIEHWVTLLKARAIENQAYVIGVNRVGDDPRYSHTGRSLISDYWGKILSEAGEGETLFSAEVDAEEMRVYREKLPFLSDVRASY